MIQGGFLVDLMAVVDVDTMVGNFQMNGQDVTVFASFNALEYIYCTMHA